MNPLGALLEKPWLSPGPGPATAAPAGEPVSASARKLGLNLFLLIVTVIFGLVAMAYMMRMGHAVPEAPQGSDWRAMREPPLLWINSAILAASSLAFAAAARALRAGEEARVRRTMLLGGMLGIAFLVGQLLLWRMFADWGYALRYGIGLCRAGDPLSTFPFPPTILGNPALAFFYLISGLHGVHILGGLAAWAIAARQLSAGGATAVAARRSLLLCARYWHFLLLIWAAMMGLFVAT